MRFYLDEDFRPEYLKLVTNTTSDEYYVNMMIAWYLATALAKQWDATIPYIEKRILPAWVHHKNHPKGSGKLPDHGRTEMLSKNISVV